LKKAKRGGKAIKLSHELISLLKNKQRKNESYDSVMRRVLGMPTRTGKDQLLEVFYILTRPRPIVFSELKDAVGESMIRSAMKKQQKPEKPIKVRRYV